MPFFWMSIITSDLTWKHFFSILWKGHSILCIFYWVVHWSHLPLSLKSQRWHLFPTLRSVTSCCQLEDAFGGNIYTIKSTNTIHQGCFLLFRNLVVEHLPAHHESYQLLKVHWMVSGSMATPGALSPWRGVDYHSWSGSAPHNWWGYKVYFVTYILSGSS